MSSTIDFARKQASSGLTTIHIGAPDVGEVLVDIAASQYHLYGVWHIS